MNEKHRRTAIILAASVITVALLYIGGLLGQLMTNYNRWMDSGGMLDGTLLPAPDFGLFTCLIHAFSLNGIKSIFLILAAGAEGQGQNKGQEQGEKSFHWEPPYRMCA